MKKLKAFTLVELIVAIVILGIILTIGVVKFDFVNIYKERLEVNLIVDSINSARTNAINTGYENEVTMYEEGSNITIKDNGKLNHININRVKLIGETSKVKFNSTGAPTKACTFELQGKKHYKITVEVATGKVNLYEED